jgi:hypothetical protein
MPQGNIKNQKTVNQEKRKIIYLYIIHFFVVVASVENKFTWKYFLTLQVS